MRIFQKLVLKGILESDLEWPFISTLYDQCMDTNILDDEGGDALNSIKTLIDKMKNVDDVVDVLGLLHSLQLYPFFQFSARYPSDECQIVY
jgi:hypothetical protein